MDRSIEWNHLKVKELIHAYENRPELWHKQHCYYNVRWRKAEAWLKIAREMGCSEQEVKYKINSVLASFRRERIRIRTKAAQGITIRPTWFAFKWFDFLSQRDKSILDGDNENETIKQDESDTQDVDFQEYYYTDIKDIEIENDPLNSTDTVDQPSHIGTASSTIISEPVINKTKKKSYVEPKGIIQMVNCKQNNVENDDQTTHINPGSDECITFGTHLVTKLRKFPEPQRSVLMHEINGVVLEAEVKLYTE